MEYKAVVLNPVPQFTVICAFLFPFFLHPAEKTAQLQALIVQVEEGDKKINKHHLVLEGTLPWYLTFWSSNIFLSIYMHYSFSNYQRIKFGIVVFGNVKQNQ